jgi:hypothetical protein
VRAAAIQDAIGYLRRVAYDGTPLFRLHPRFVIVSDRGHQETAVLQQIFEGGYTYDSKRTYSGTQFHGIRPPRKDGFYEHPANCVEYFVTAFGPPGAAERAGVLRNPGAVQRARQVLEEQGISAAEIAQILASDSRQSVLDARVERERQRAEQPPQREYQRDTVEASHKRMMLKTYGIQARPPASLRRGGY